MGPTVVAASVGVERMSGIKFCLKNRITRNSIAEQSYNELVGNNLRTFLYIRGRSVTHQPL